MDEKEMADAIRKKCAELSELTHAAAVMGISVDIDVRREGMIGVPEQIIMLMPRIRRMQEL